MAWPSTHNTYRLLSNLMCLKLQNSFKLASHIVVPCATMKHHGATGILIGQSPAIKIHFTVL